MKLRNKALLAALTDVSGIGDARAYELYTHYNEPTNLFRNPAPLLEEYYYLDKNALAELRSLDERIEEYVERFETYESAGINVLAIEDDRYPTTLRTSSAPIILYAKGNIELLNNRAVGISGARSTNDTGQQWAGEISKEIAEAGYTAVSGGARGADTAAHKGALGTAGSTIAVLGTGVNVAYPPENQSLFEKIIDTGGLLISMRQPNAEPTRHSFINRNQLIASLSDGMIFVAADNDGGTFKQYTIAVKQSLPVFVPPRNLDIEPSTGLTTIQNSEDTAIIQSHTDLSGISQTSTQQRSLDEWE